MQLMSGNLEQFGGYQKALGLFDLVVDDMTRLSGDRKLERLVSQQISRRAMVAKAPWNTGVF
jgi:hypothetical protein